MSTIILQNTLETITCVQCGVVFAVPSVFKEGRHNDGADFYCPSGHALCFSSRIKKMQAERDSLAKDLPEQNCALLRLEIEKSELEKNAHRVIHRIQNGVSPHCNRSFQNIHRHMRSKHKTVLAEQQEKK